MQTFMDKTKSRLLKKFHTLCGVAGVNAEGKSIILESYGVTSSRDLNTYELLELCDKLEKQANPTLAELDTWRKRVIAAVDGYLRAMGQMPNITLIKAVACRAAQCSDFNRIPKERLTSIYNAFKHRKSDLEAVDKLTEEFLLGKFDCNQSSC